MDGAAELGDLGLAAHRHALEEGVDELLVEVRRLDAAEGDEIHAHVLLRPVGAEIARQVDQRGFRRGVGDRLLERLAVALLAVGIERLVRRHHAVHRADIDDGAAPRLRHARTDDLAAQHDAGQVGVDDLVPVLLRIDLERAVLVGRASRLGVDAGIVDQHVGHAPVGDEFRGRGLQRRLVGDAGDVDPDAVGQAGKLRFQVRAPERTPAVDGDLRTGLRQRRRELRAELAEPAGDDADAILDSEHVVHRVVLGAGRRRSDHSGDAPAGSNGIALPARLRRQPRVTIRARSQTCGSWLPSYYVGSRRTG